MMNFRCVAAGLLVACGMTGAAYAGAVSGSDSVIVGSVGTSPSTDLLSTLTNGGDIVLSSLFWGTGSGDLANVPFFTPISATTLTLSPAGFDAFAFSSTSGSFDGATAIAVGAGHYLAQVTGSSGSIANGSETIGVYMVGNFTPAGSLSALDPNTMDVVLTLNENGITGSSPSGLGSFSGSFTVSSPAGGPPGSPPADVPEPVSALLLGTGLLGLAMVRVAHSQL